LEEAHLMSTLAAPVVDLHAQPSHALHDLLADYPDLLEQADAECWAMLKTAKLHTFDANTIMFSESMECKHLMLVVEGKVRVFKDSDEGREMTLYRVEPGELCIHNLNNLVNGLPYPIMAQAETKMRGLVINRSEFNNAMAKSDSFRNYVLRSLTERLAKMMNLVSGLAFDRLDLRIAVWLHDQFERNCGRPIAITHSELGHELGTTREMVSRILKDFEHKRCIKLARGSIHLNCKNTLKLVSLGKGKAVS